MSATSTLALVSIGGRRLDVLAQMCYTELALGRPQGETKWGCCEMLELKACPRCRGDMRVSQDTYGNYKQCFQCGNTIELKPTTKRRHFPTMRVETPKIGRDSAAAEPVGDLTLFDG